jgi:hypothetical protein
LVLHLRYGVDNQGISVPLSAGATDNFSLTVFETRSATHPTSPIVSTMG